MGVFKELLDAGKVRMVGISNANIDQIDLARSILGEGNLVSVQNQFSPAFRSSEDELRYCGDLGIAFLPWSPFGGIGQADVLRREHPPSAVWLLTTTSRSTRSSWPGCWRRATTWSRSRAPAGPASARDNAQRST